MKRKRYTLTVPHEVLQEHIQHTQDPHPIDDEKWDPIHFGWFMHIAIVYGG